MNKKKSIAVPDEVRDLCVRLATGGFEAHLVGGCVRDILLGREPKDWDVATNAKPDEVQALFPDSVYENAFGTVGVKTESKDPRTAVIEVTSYRIEGGYRDKRHPDVVAFAKTIEEDLSRRDFTVNAMAMDLAGRIVDPWGGERDIERRIVRTVGDPGERFAEDALRLMRAVRFSVELDFEIDSATRAAAAKLASELEAIAKERIRDEFTKIIMTPGAARGVLLLEDLGLLKFILPELREGIGVGQNKHHVYSVFEHNIRALDYAAGQDYSFEIRMSSLLHDVGKPRSKKGDGPDSTFYQHEYIGAKMAVKMLDRLRYPRAFVEQVAHLIRRHMFFYDVGTVTAAGVRRFIVRVGPENIDDLLRVREADRIGSGVAKAVPYRLRHFLFMIEKVKRDPLTPRMLAINGDDIMKELGLPEGMRVGWILHALLEEVIDDPEKNTAAYLMGRARALNAMDDAALRELMVKAREKERAAEEAEEEKIKKSFRV